VLFGEKHVRGTCDLDGDVGPDLHGGGVSGPRGVLADAACAAQDFERTVVGVVGGAALAGQVGPGVERAERAV